MAIATLLFVYLTVLVSDIIGIGYVGLALRAWLAFMLVGYENVSLYKISLVKALG